MEQSNRTTSFFSKPISPAKKNASLFLLLFSVLLTLLLPLISIPLNIFGLVFTSGKIRKTYGLLLAFSLAMIAYIWIPRSTMDLYRHHQQVYSLSGFNFDELGKLIADNLEPLQYLTKFVVAQIGNYGLLQFFVIFCGYFELFWLTCDIAEVKRIKKLGFSLLLLFAFSAVKFIDFASGLWFNLALINLFVGIYMFYFRGNKFKAYLFYIIAACLHVGVLYIVLPVIVLSHLKIFQKYRLVTMFSIFLVYLLFGTILSLLSDTFGSGFKLLDMTSHMYNSYYTNGSQFDSLHTGWNMYLPIINIAISLIMAIFCLKDDGLKKYSCFVMYILMCILASIINAGVFVRYGFFAAMLAMPLLADFIKNNKNRQLGSFVVVIITILIMTELSRSFSQLQSVGLLSRIADNIGKSTFIIMKGSNE